MALAFGSADRSHLAFILIAAIVFLTGALTAALQTLAHHTSCGDADSWPLALVNAGADQVAELAQPNTTTISVDGVSIGMYSSSLSTWSLDRGMHQVNDQQLVNRTTVSLRTSEFETQFAYQLTSTYLASPSQTDTCAALQAPSCNGTLTGVCACFVQYHNMVDYDLTNMSPFEMPEHLNDDYKAQGAQADFDTLFVLPIVELRALTNEHMAQSSVLTGDRMLCTYGWGSELLFLAILTKVVADTAMTTGWLLFIFNSMWKGQAMALHCLIGAAASTMVESKWLRSPRSSRHSRHCCEYDPGLYFAGDCLFASLAYCITGRKPTRAEVARIRALCAEIWRRAPLPLLKSVAAKEKLTPEQYVTAIRHDMWGGLSDVELFVEVLGLSLQVRAEGKVFQFGHQEARSSPLTPNTMLSPMPHRFHRGRSAHTGCCAELGTVHKNSE
eukprot:4156935-Amphidinium_carterae.1